MTAATRTVRRLGFIGLGVMGSAQSANLVRKGGKPVTVFDVSADAVDRLVAQGAEAGGSAAEVAASSDVVFLSLPGAQQVEDVLTGSGNVFATARPGTIVVDLSTVPVELARTAGAQAAALGLAYIDAPVARTRKAAVDGTLSITAGGDTEVFATVEPLLRTMATDIVHCGPNGAGALIKLVNNLVVFETVVALAEALTLVRRSGLVDPAVAFEALAHGSAASFTLENHGRKALLPDIHAEGIFPAAYMRKDIGYALQLAEQLQLNLPAAQLAHDLLSRTVDGGLAQAYHTAVVRVIEGTLP
jgi:3-hydroxyisobutyrate dehydrogenase-like beta-hydroxyacid dehydrogenase